MRIIVCIVVAGLFLYAYVAKQNEVMRLRLDLPVLTKQVQQIEEENIRLEFEIEQYESPILLMELLTRPEYGHLKHPLFGEIHFVE